MGCSKGYYGIGDPGWTWMDDRGQNKEGKKTDYEQLVKALRECGERAFCNDCPIFDTCDGDIDRAMHDAAAAIEALQAELAGSKDAIRILKHNLEMKLSKRGEWLIHSTGGSMATKKCPFCGSESWQSKEYAKVPKYCENCGAHLPTFKIMDWVDYLYAKTEVQE